MDLLFTNPTFMWLAAGLVTIPLVIHLLNRRRHREVPWAAMIFLMAANRKSAHRMRLENLLLLALRTLAIGLVPLAMARPLLKSAMAAGLLGDERHHLLLLDPSLSMAARSSPGGPSAFDQQIQQASEIIDNLPAGSRVTLISAGFPARRVNSQPASPAPARQLLTALEQGTTHTDLTGALTIAGQILDASPGEQDDFTIHILSDFTPAVLEDAEPAALPEAKRPGLGELARSLAARARLTLIQVGGPAPPNMAIAGLSLGSPLVGTRRITDVLVQVSNFASIRSPETTVELLADGQPFTHLTVPAVDPGAHHVLTAALEFDSAGLHALEARLTAPAGNALPEDDRRRLVVRAREQVPVLMVDGKPGAGPLDGHAGYVATALAPRAHAGESTFIDVHVVSESELATIQMDRYDLLILCNVRRLPEARWQDVERFVQRGRGLIVFMGDLVDVTHYNRQAARLLPAELQGPAFTPANEEQFTRFSPVAVAPDLAEVFGGRKNSGLFLARVHQYLHMGRADQPSAGTPVLVYENGDLAVALRQVGAGRCVWCTTTANMDWTNLPAKGDFVTLCMSLLRRAAPANEADRNLTAGEEFTHLTDSAAAGCTLLSPAGQNLAPDLSAGSRGLQFDFGRLETIGWYTLEGSAQQGPVAVNSPAAESDLRRLDPAEIERELGCEYTWVAVGPGLGPLIQSPGQGVSAALLYAALMLLLVEPLAALAFGHHRH